MERYNSTPNTIDTEKHYLTTKYPEISRTDTDIYIFVHKGTRLTDLSNLYYGTVTNWFILALANNLGKGSICVPNHIDRKSVV